jgi:hypothetical protein
MRILQVLGYGEQDLKGIQQALHQVRDVVLSGCIPLVFWEEFDTTLGAHPWGWLRYFLAQILDDGTGAPHIDPGVLRAFLQVREYRHGTRSMESIFATSRLTGQRTFEYSALPSKAQLAIHADGREFHALVQAPEMTSPLLEKLTAAAHHVYSKQELAQAKDAQRDPRPDTLVEPNSPLSHRRRIVIICAASP